MCSLMMISDMLSKHVGAVKSVLKKLFKINDTISAFVGSVIISELCLYLSFIAWFLKTMLLEQKR